MSDELQVVSNTAIAPLSTQISVPSHDTPQIDLGQPGFVADTELSPLEQRVSETEPTGAPRLSPKRFWNNSIKNVFNSLSPKQQRAWLDSFDVVERAYHKQTEAMKQSFAALDDVAGVLAPYLEDIVLKLKQTPGQYLANLLKADEMATKNPIDYILTMMGRLRITFDDLELRLPDLTEEVKIQKAAEPLVQSKVRNLEQKLRQYEQAAQPQEYYEPSFTEDDVESAAQEIERYFSQTDSSGRLLYPNAQDMFIDIVDALEAGAPTLHDAYMEALNARGVQIPQTEFRGVAGSDDNYDAAQRQTEFVSKLKEKQMLKNIVEQLRSRGA